MRAYVPPFLMKAFHGGRCWLAAVAGFVDAACFLGLSSVFTAHVTGNIAALASAIVQPTPETELRLEVLVSFCIGAVACSLQARRTAIPLRWAVLLRLEAVLLAALLLAQAATAATPWQAHAVACLAGAAMGCQTALAKTSGVAGDPTTVMTSNLAQWIALFVVPDPPDSEEAAKTQRETRRHLMCSLVLFSAGAALGSVGQHVLGFWSLAAPLFVLVLLIGVDR